MIILQGYWRGGKKIRIQRISKNLHVAPYVRVSIKEQDNQAATPTVDLSKLSDEEIWVGLYIPTHERVFRNPPDDDPSQALFVLQDWLRQKAKMKQN